MRIVTYGAACSLDGFIARTDGGIDWLLFTKDVQAVMQAYWQRIDTVLMGRKTWDVAAAQGHATGFGLRTVVFSRTLQAPPCPGIELVGDDPGGFVRRLKEEPGKDICVMGGGDLARSLFAADMIDEVGLNVHPVLLGKGVPLFLDPGRQTDLELVSSRTMAKGCLYLMYRVRR